jgi:hypothetical protein
MQTGGGGRPAGKGAERGAEFHRAVTLREFGGLASSFAKSAGGSVGDKLPLAGVFGGLRNCVRGAGKGMRG